MFSKKKQKNKDNVPEEKDVAKKKDKDYGKRIEENVNIYVMPERFRTVHVEKDKAKTMGLAIMIGGVIFLISVSALAYFYFFKKDEPKKAGPVATSTAQEVNKTTPPPAPTPTPTSTPTPSPDPVEIVKEPREMYIEIRMELDEVNVFSDYEKIIIEYGSRDKIALLEDEKNNTIGSEENIESFMESKTAPKVQDLKDIKVSKAGNTANLIVTMKDKSREGSVVFKKEGEDWKLDSELWKSTEAPVVVVNPIENTSGLDTDNDGLTDNEEGYFGSSFQASDSDGDGFNDLSEIINLYNPAGDGSLVDNPNISKYVNTTYTYNILHPTSWTLSQVGGDESVVIRSRDNQFIQIIVQPNSVNQTIDNWYRAQFDVSSIDGSRKVSGSNWSGIKSEDGLIVYITDTSNNSIFTISYNLGESNVLEYKNIFNLVIGSLEVVVN